MELVKLLLCSRRIAYSAAAVPVRTSFLQS